MMLARNDRDDRLVPGHALVDEAGGQQPGRDVDRHADPQGQVVVGGPGPLRRSGPGPGPRCGAASRPAPRPPRASAHAPVRVDDLVHRCRRHLLPPQCFPQRLLPRIGELALSSPRSLGAVLLSPPSATPRAGRPSSGQCARCFAHPTQPRKGLRGRRASCAAGGHGHVCALAAAPARDDDHGGRPAGAPAPPTGASRERPSPRPLGCRPRDARRAGLRARRPGARRRRGHDAAHGGRAHGRAARRGRRRADDALHDRVARRDRSRRDRDRRVPSSAGASTAARGSGSRCRAQPLAASPSGSSRPTTTSSPCGPSTGPETGAPG